MVDRTKILVLTFAFFASMCQLGHTLKFDCYKQFHLVMFFIFISVLPADVTGVVPDLDDR